MLRDETIALAVLVFGEAWGEANKTATLPPGHGERRKAGLLAVLNHPTVQRDIVANWRDDQEAASSEMLAQAAQDRTAWPHEEKDLPF